MEQEKTNSICDLCQKGSIIKLFSVFLLVLVLFFLVKTYGVLKENKFIGQDIVARNTINVQGEGEVSAVPDIAKFSFSVKEESLTVSEAQTVVTKKMNSVLDFLKQSEVDEKNIKTTGYNIYPRYEWQSEKIACYGLNCPVPDRERILVGYEVSQNISVRLENIDKAGEVLAGIGALEVTNVSGLSFEIDDEDDLKRQARKEAIEEAQGKAKQLAKDLGVSLVRIVNYSSNEGNTYPQYAVMEKSMAFGMGGDVAVPEIPVGENEIKMIVYITYEIK